MKIVKQIFLSANELFFQEKKKKESKQNGGAQHKKIAKSDRYV